MDSLLHHRMRFSVMGLDSVLKHVVAAKDKHQSLCGAQCRSLLYQQWELKEDVATVQKMGCFVRWISGQSWPPCQCPSKGGTTVPGGPPIVPPHIRDTSQSNESTSQSNESTSQSNESTSQSNESTFQSNESTSQSNESITFLGLHACADLSPLIMRMFMCCQEVSAMVLVSCCYHKMKCISSPDEESAAPTEGEGESSGSSAGSEELPSLSSLRPDGCEALYRNFPLSQRLANEMCRRRFSLSVYGLRLAAQEPGVRWLGKSAEDHTKHQHAMLYRAVLREVCSIRKLLVYLPVKITVSNIVFCMLTLYFR